MAEDIDSLLDAPGIDDVLATDLELCDLAGRAEGVARERRRLRKLVEAGAEIVSAPGSLVVLRPLAWDTRHFGFGCADITRVYGTDPPVAQAVERARRSGVRLLSARCRAEQVDLCGVLQEQGFNLVDTSVEMGAPIAPPAPPSRARPARPEDAEAMRAIGRTFLANRFHLDRRFDRERADALYESWAVRQPALVVEGEGRVAGFSGWRPPEEDDPLGVGSLTLIVIAPESRGQGHFAELVAGVKGALLEAGARLMVTSTQVHNARALRAFSREGLRPFSARHVFHRWI